VYISMKTIVISLGGSIINPGKINISFLKKFRKLILSQKNKFIIICGGGFICREYINASKYITKARPRDHDWIGIRTTEVNAELVRSMFYKVSTDTIQPDYTKKVRFKKVLVGAGLIPGTSSDYDAVMYAKNYGVKEIINMSNISYVYDKDPKKFKKAKPIKYICWKHFRQLIDKKWIAGLNLPFDPVASKKAQQYGLRVIILKGTDLKNIENLLNNKSFKGTVIE